MNGNVSHYHHSDKGSRFSKGMCASGEDGLTKTDPSATEGKSVSVLNKKSGYISNSTALVEFSKNSPEAHKGIILYAWNPLLISDNYCLLNQLIELNSINSD